MCKGFIWVLVRIAGDPVHPFGRADEAAETENMNTGDVGMGVTGLVLGNYGKVGIGVGITEQFCGFQSQVGHCT